MPGQKNIKGSYKALLVLYPLLSLFFPGLKPSQLGRAMINCVRAGGQLKLLEAPDIKAISEA